MTTYDISGLKVDLGGDDAPKANLARDVLADIAEDEGNEALSVGLRRRSVSVRWWRDYSTTGRIVQCINRCEVPLIAGWNNCQVLHEGLLVSKTVIVFVSRWNNGWILQPEFPGYEEYDVDGFPYLTNDEKGFEYLVRDDQPSIVWTWLPLDELARSNLGHRYNLTINDGRLVETGVGPQINPNFRRGVNDPNEWVGPID